MILPIRAVLMLVFMAETLSAQSVLNIRSAVSRALPVLQRSAGEFVEKRACVSCHHNILTILTLDLARSRGFEVNKNTSGCRRQDISRTAWRECFR